MTPEDKKPAAPRIRVRIADIQPFAKKQCKTCFGAGEFSRLAQATRQVDDKTKLVPGGPISSTQLIVTPCRCALSRFLRAQPCVRDEAGHLYFGYPIKHISDLTLAAYEAEHGPIVPPGTENRIEAATAFFSGQPEAP